MEKGENSDLSLNQRIIFLNSDGRYIGEWDSEAVA